VSAIAHFLEEEGIATTLVALIRPHAEKARPPRALWVPFQLGRPVGGPGQADFQRTVIRSALALLESTPAPSILEDFPEDEPDSACVVGWAAPAGLSADTVLAEIEALAPWYERSKQRSGRTTVGITGLDISTVARYLLSVDGERPLPNPRADFAPVKTLRYAVDDLKAYYLEAATEASERASGWQLANWFWESTQGGQLVKQLHENSFDHRVEERRHAAWWLVPDGWASRETVERTWKVSH
jgi:hypothetical protein